MVLASVPFQLRLPGMGLPSKLVRYRTDEWEWTASNVIKRLQNSVAYCLFQRSRWNFLRERWCPEKDWYLDGSNFLSNHIERFYEPKTLQLVLPPLNSSEDTHNNEQVEELSREPRKWLAAQLLAADPKYTDARILSHLPRLKLARMLVRALETCSQHDRRRA